LPPANARHEFGCEPSRRCDAGGPEGDEAPTLLLMEDVAAKFEAAWEVFARTCANAVAPEATFQAWFAHYLISQFGIDRVAREPIFKHLHAESKWQSLVPGG